MRWPYVVNTTLQTASFANFTFLEVTGCWLPYFAKFLVSYCLPMAMALIFTIIYRLRKWCYPNLSARSLRLLLLRSFVSFVTLFYTYLLTQLTLVHIRTPVGGEDR